MHRCEGATIPLTQWEVEYYPAGCMGDSAVWQLQHYVGGEEYMHYGRIYSSKADAEKAAAHLNSTLPPEGYTHFYYSE